jgi:hypothetical protein
MTREWLSFISEKHMASGWPLRLENLSWPNHALYRNFYRTNAAGHTQQWGCTKLYFFIRPLLGFPGPFFILQPQIEAAKPFAG